MKLRYALVVASLCIGACEKKTDSVPVPAAASAATPATPTGASTAAAPGAGGASPATGGAAAAPRVAVGPGGTVVAANDHGKVVVNDAGVLTARRADGDKVVVAPGGTTTANGVVVDSKKGTVVVPGVGTFATPPQ